VRVEHPHRHRGEGHQRQERKHHARELDGDRDLAGNPLEAGRERAHEGPREDESHHDERAQHHHEQRHQAVGQTVGALGAAFLQRAGIRRDERRGKRPLREQVAQQVGDAEGGLEGVRVEPGPQQRREDLLAHEAEHAGEEDERGDDARAADEPASARGVTRVWLDRLRQVR
jgi:hypothetical protein